MDQVVRGLYISCLEVADDTEALRLNKIDGC